MVKYVQRRLFGSLDSGAIIVCTAQRFFLPPDSAGSLTGLKFRNKLLAYPICGQMRYDKDKRSQGARGGANRK